MFRLDLPAAPVSTLRTTCSRSALYRAHIAEFCCEHCNLAITITSTFSPPNVWWYLSPWL